MFLLGKERITNIESASIGETLRDYFDQCDTSIFIVSPFISNDVIETIVSSSKTNKISIVTSWRSDHLKSGVSSLDLYNITKKHGWTLYINSKIHAKIFSKSFDSCYMGSFNCTRKALFETNGNIECIKYIDKMSVGNRVELNKIISSSTLVDDRIFEQYQDWFSEIASSFKDVISEPNIRDLTPFYIFQLPAMKSPSILWDYINNPELFIGQEGKIEHDLALYSSLEKKETKEEFMEDIRKIFFAHPFIVKIDSEIKKEGTRFGYFKEFIQRICVDVPVPYRKDLTELVQNLYSWFSELNPKKYKTNVPGRHSQVIYKTID